MIRLNMPVQTLEIVELFEAKIPEDLLRESLRKQTLNAVASHPDTLTTMNSFATLLEYESRYQASALLGDFCHSILTSF